MWYISKRQRPTIQQFSQDSDFVVILTCANKYEQNADLMFKIFHSYIKHEHLIVNHS